MRRPTSLNRIRAALAAGPASGTALESVFREVRGARELLQAAELLRQAVERDADLLEGKPGAEGAEWATSRRDGLREQLAAQRWRELLAELEREPDPQRRLEYLRGYVQHAGDRQPRSFLERGRARLAAEERAAEDAAVEELLVAPRRDLMELERVLVAIEAYLATWPAGRRRSEVEAFRSQAEGYRELLRLCRDQSYDPAAIQAAVTRALDGSPGRFAAELRALGAAWSRVRVTLRVDGATVPESGFDWSSLPDPYVELKRAGALVLRTPTVDDSAVAGFGTTAVFDYRPGDAFHLAVFDEDIGSDDRIESTSLPDLRSLDGEVRMGQATVRLSLLSVEPTLEPGRPPAAP